MRCHPHFTNKAAHISSSVPGLNICLHVWLLFYCCSYKLRSSTFPLVHAHTQATGLNLFKSQSSLLWALHPLLISWGVASSLTRIHPIIFCPSFSTLLSTLNSHYVAYFRNVNMFFLKKLLFPHEGKVGRLYQMLYIYYCLDPFCWSLSTHLVEENTSLNKSSIP